MEDHNNLTTVSKELTPDTGQMAQLADQQRALVPYIPKSAAPYRMDTLIPRNMAFEVQSSLNRIVKEKGNIDTYVRDGLKYVSTDAMWKALASEQVDALALYTKQFERGQGIIIADQTGIGKGRQAAAVIRHAVQNGYLPIFFTKSPNLFTDIYRDLKAIDFADIHPFIVNTDHAAIKDEHGNVMFSPLQGETQMELLTYSQTYAVESPESLEWHRKMRLPLPNPEAVPTITIHHSSNELPRGYDMIFCTYSQIQAAHYFKRQWIENLCDAGVEGSKHYKEVVFVLDESHLAGGFESIIGTWMRGVLPKTKACCFLSATFAKYPQVMPFYGKKTAIVETGMKDSHLVDSMTRGGLALQEIIASNLSESGQLIRRQRSNEGIEIDYITLDQEPQRSLNRQRVNRIIALMNQVVHFERQYIDPVITGIHAEAKANAELVKHPPKGLGVKQAPYFSRVFNVIDQMLFALKVEGVAQQTIEALQQDKKVVIGFKSTMGAFLKEMNLANGDLIEPEELDFVRTLLKGLESVFYYSHTDIYGEKERRKVALEELSPSGVRAYKRIKKAMLEERSNLSITPIDQLIHLIEQTEKPKGLGGHNESHFRVAEITGRHQRIYFQDDEAIVTSFRKDVEASYRLFNAGEYDVLMINQSGSTGASAHASKDFIDQRQRVMIIHQFDLDVNIVMQILGRVNRTGQVNLPRYVFMISDIPMEVRLMTMLKAKLKSLDANTTGSQHTNDQTLESEDFINKYGDDAAWNWIEENPDMLEALGYPTYSKFRNPETKKTEYKRVDFRDGAIRQLTGRAGLLLVEEQERLYHEILERYKHQVIIEKQRGTYDLETEFLPLNAEVQKKFLYRQGNGGNTPFGKDTLREKTVVDNVNRPFTKNEIDSRLMELLQQKSAQQIKDGLLLKIEKEYPAIIESQRKNAQALIDDLELEVAMLPDPDTSEEEDNGAHQKNAIERKRLYEVIAEKQHALEDYMKALEYTKTKILRYIGYWNIGDLVKVPVPGTIAEEPSWGIFLGVQIGKGMKNPYVESNITFLFAVADGRKTLTYSLRKPEHDFISLIYAQHNDISEEDRQHIPQKWDDIIKKVSSKRESRQLLTENILAASGEIGIHNKLIKYNTISGVIKNGILMSRDFGKDGEHRALLPISNALKAIETMENDTTFEDHQFGVRFKRIGQNHYQVYFNKKEHYQLPLDTNLRKLVMREPGQPESELADFVQNAGEMTAALAKRNLEAFLLLLDEYGIKVEGEARELEDWEIENQQDWSDRTKKSSLVVSYELGRSYGQGSNPLAGFLSYQPPGEGNALPYGSVSYSRELSDKEKYNYTLVPIFKNIAVPYLEWKKSLTGTPIATEFKVLVGQATSKPIYKAIDLLGYFITNHPHQDGNAEFVFGRYTPQELGKACYEDMIREITPIRGLLDKLKLYYELLAG